MGNIGILTFHSANNYGAVLQAVSLMRAVQKTTNTTCEIIDYEPEFIRADYSLNPFRKHHVKTILKNMLRFRAKAKRNRFFNVYRSRYLACSTRVKGWTEFVSICNSYDKIIVGSDQVWNYRLTENDLHYFLADNAITAKKYAYAASTGDVTYDESICEKMLDAILQYRYLSVREENSKTILQNKLGDRNIDVVLDPVFLTSKKEWKLMASSVPDEPYILFVKMGYSKKADPAMQYAQKLSQMMGCKLKLLWDQEMWFRYRNIDHVGVVSPSEYLGWISHAKCVITNSFHATALSIILNTPFYVETQIDRKDRVLNLLSIFGLERNGLCVGESMEGTITIPDVDWQCVNERIEMEQRRSLRYLELIVND